MSLLEDCIEIHEIYERDKSNQSFFREISKIIKNNSKVVRGFEDIEPKIVFDYENIGKQIIVAIKSHKNCFDRVETKKESNEIDLEYFYLRNQE